MRTFARNINSHFEKKYRCEKATGVRSDVKMRISALLRTFATNWLILVRKNKVRNCTVRIYYIIVLPNINFVS